VLYFAILFPLLFLACEKQQPLDKDFALAYAKLRIAEHEYGDAEEGKVARFQILQKHNLDLNTFEEKIEEVKKVDANWLKFQRIVVDAIDSINKKNKESIENKENKDNKEVKEKKETKANKEKREIRKKREQK
jgi:sialic acid synthase SpsE